MTSPRWSSNKTLCHISRIITVVFDGETDSFYKSIAKNGSISLSCPDWTIKYGVFNDLYCFERMFIATNKEEVVVVHIPPWYMCGSVYKYLVSFLFVPFLELALANLKAGKRKLAKRTIFLSQG
jgi:hypothetical protein